MHSTIKSVNNHSTLTQHQSEEQSDFKTTTLRFTNNNFKIEGPSEVMRFHQSPKRDKMRITAYEDSIPDNSCNLKVIYNTDEIKEEISNHETP